MTQLVAEPYLEPGEILGEEEEGPPPLLARLRRPFDALRAVPDIGTWLGVALSAAGLALIVVAWGRTAGLVNVALQVPYVVSAGFTGLALVVVGIAVVSISAKKADAEERLRQVRELREALADLRQALEDQR